MDIAPNDLKALKEMAENTASWTWITDNHGNIYMDLKPTEAKSCHDSPVLGSPDALIIGLPDTRGSIEPDIIPSAAIKLSQAVIALIDVLESTRLERDYFKKVTHGNDSFLNAMIHISKQSWDEALAKRIESLESDNRHLDETYTKSRELLDQEISGLRTENKRLNEMISWLIYRLVDCGYNKKPVPEKEADVWRQEADEACKPE